MIHSCIDVLLEDKSPSMEVDLDSVYNPVDINYHTVDSYCDVEIYDSVQLGDCNISDACLTDANINIESDNEEEATISLEWVCGVGFSERYLCGSDSELITIDGNYLVVKYKSES